jgi:PAS domain S-box-containing protein
MALDRVVGLLEARRGAQLDTLVGAVLEAVPRYELLSGVELRESLGGLIDALLHLLKTGDRAAVRDLLLQNVERRVAQGFTAADYLRALFIIPATLTSSLRTEAGSDQATLAQVEALGPTLMELVASAGNFFVDQLGRQLHTKNAELNRLNQQLAAQQKALKSEVSDTVHALAASTELNRRVIESLSSGLMVTEQHSTLITLYSSRLEEITGIATEDALGRPVSQAFAGVGGLDVGAVVSQVSSTGTLPLTKLHITLPNGRKKAVYVRAQSLRDEAGEAMGSVVVVDDISERELLLDSFSRYVSRDLVKRLLARAEPLGLEGERKVCTILFADVRGFTSLAEGQTPEDLHRLLNLYFHLMIDAILSNGGFIDKFVGDKVMALFTSGTHDKDNAVAALNAARQIKTSLAALNLQRRADGLPALEVGVGVNSGEVLLGNIGSDRRMEFTAIGDPVNVADRLQHLARTGEVFVGAATAALVDGVAGFRLIDKGEQEMRGRQAFARVFELEI